MKNSTLVFLSIFTLIYLSNCSTPPPKEDQLGKVEIQFTGDEEAQAPFKKGLLLLHNFEYEDARDAFLEAQKIDSTFVMTYWGEAMTHNHPLWRQQDYEKGNEALNKLAATVEERKEKAQTELEKDFLSAVETLYGEGSKYERDSSYSAHLGNMYKKYPDNQEVGAFYALSILGAVPVGRDEVAYEKGAKVVKGIIEENPNHPGALHYLIHSYDDPGHAHLAINAANSYSEVAADAAHALHMPSHIYVAVGMWDEVVTSNVASWNSSVNRMKAKELDNDALSYHALQWKMYGLLNLGRHEEAAQLIRDMNKYCSEKSSKSARRYLIGMKGNYLVETGDWESDIADFDMDREDMNISHRASFAFMEGMKAFLNGDTERLSSIISEMETERDESSRQVSESGVPMCSAAGSNRYAPNQADLDQATVMEMELKALNKWNTSEAEEWLRKASDLEMTINYSFGPPYIPKPSFELYADWLLEQDRLEDAAAQLERALERGPRRVSALKGQLEIARRQNDREAVKNLESTLKDMLKEADSEFLNKILPEELLTEKI